MEQIIRNLVLNFVLQRIKSIIIRRKSPMKKNLYFFKLRGKIDIDLEIAWEN